MLKITGLLLPVFLLLGSDAQFDALQIGDKAPMINHRVEDISERTITLSEVAGRKGLLVIFTCNTCPWVARWENRYNGLARLAESNGIGVISLNPNERIRNRGESLEDMRKRAQKQNYNFPYALDKDHQLADAFGATKTPELFLFDGDLRLVYHGSVDDNAENAAQVKEKYAENAINAIISGAQVPREESQSLGCTIKRGE